MKKVFLIGALGIFTLASTASCVKVRTCNCTTTSSTNDYAEANAFTVTGTKKDARRICEGNNETNGTFTKSCTLQ